VTSLYVIRVDNCKNLNGLSGFFQIDTVRIDFHWNTSVVGQLPVRCAWRIGDALFQYWPFILVLVPVRFDGGFILMKIAFRGRDGVDVAV
jgi:hypothetical protein